ncbi:MAG: sporulation protein YhbH [Clostridia bacterium]|nr:sporulation protein YhbH [Clostridia bacterium]
MTRFTICREDWSLHRKGYLDQERHREKVREAIKNNLSEIISEESIVLSDGQKVIKVPVRAIEEYRFRFDPDKQNLVGQGYGNSQPGDLVASGRPGGSAKGRTPGTEAGNDYFEAEVTIEEVAEIMFEELCLPNLELKERPHLTAEGTDFRDVRKKGLAANLDRHRTVLSVLRKNLLQGQPGFHSVTPEDLRFRTWDVHEKPESGAVVLAMMDTSGSMGPFEKYIARTYFFWMTRFLRTRYRNVDVVFLSHHTEARESTEEEFFTKGESGGTRCSSVYKLALKVVEERYPPQDYNIYAFHFSDGDNLTSDNDQCIELVGRLVQVVSLVGYGEIEGPYYYSSTLRSTYKRIRHPNFKTVVIRDKGDIFGALKTFFGSGST